MVEGLTSSEIAELEAFEWIEPDIGTRIDVGFAAVQQLIYNRTRGKDEKAKEVIDFMPKWGPVDREHVANRARFAMGSIQRQLEAKIKEKARNG